MYVRFTSFTIDTRVPSASACIYVNCSNTDASILALFAPTHTYHYNNKYLFDYTNFYVMEPCTNYDGYQREYHGSFH